MTAALAITDAKPIADDVAGKQAQRPTPEQLDKMVEEYLAAKLQNTLTGHRLRELEDDLVELVQAWGSVPPNAEKSRRLNGRLSELTVTKSDTITILDERVETLKHALESHERGDYFKKLFTLRSKYEIVEGAESALKTEALPKRLAEKVLNLFGRCISVKPKKPSLKVTIADPAKPAKKARAKKGGK